MELAIKTQLMDQHRLVPTAVSERLMIIRIPVIRDRSLALISVYAPTLTSEDDFKGSLYNLLDRTIPTAPAHDKLVKCNANDQLLLDLSTEHELVITNSLFRVLTRQKTTWKHPRSKHWHILDYILTRSRGRQDVRITRSMSDTHECWTYHRLLISCLNTKIRRPPKRVSAKIPF
uniref:Uncharacterized protein n=1 Tax=Octopus bimaculoides TaxID=37653 RepID=A0A0L8G8J5_OCTBM